MNEDRVQCKKCGIITTQSTLSKHQYLCDIMPIGKELDTILNTFKFLSLTEIGSWFFEGATEYFLEERLFAGGWTRDEIKQRKQLASEEKLRRGIRQRYGDGAKDRYRARCLRCDILLHHELELDLKFCKYCYTEGCVPPEAFERYFNFNSQVKKMTLNTHIGLATYGYDPTMSTFFAYVRPEINRNIVIISIGNSPNQCRTEKSFRDRLINSGLTLSETREIVDGAKAEKRNSTTKEESIKKFLIDFILLCKNTESNDQWEEDDEEDE